MTAKLDISTPNNDNGDKRSGELRVKIHGTSCGAAYEFVLKRKHIEVMRTQLPTHLRGMQDLKGSKALEKVDTDWYNWLTDEEKTQVFAVILDEYRKRSLGDNGFKGASIGAATDTLSGQTRLFIGTNTTRWASPYFKHCAEQNMVNGATDTLMYERSKDPKQDAKKPKAPEFKSIYVLQAIDDKKVPISCPCGKCTDMLSNVMVKGGEVVTLPFLLSEMRQKLAEGAKDTVKVNTDAKSLQDIPWPGQTSHYEVWKTTIEDLNRNRTIALDGKQATIQRDGAVTMLAHASSSWGLPKDRGEHNFAVIRAEMEKRTQGPLPSTALEFVPAFLNYVQNSAKLFSQKIRGLVASVAEPAQKAAENILLQRKSVPALDCAVSGSTLNIALINQFLVLRITDTVADRMRGREDVTKLTPAKQLQWLQQNIDYVRCVAIQLDDGTFRYAVQAAGKLDAAMPNAGVAALEQAVESLGRNGVRHVWAMEMNPTDIKQGILRTSPKEEIERLMKRRSAEGIDFHYIPFNNGDLTNVRLHTLVKHLGEKDIYPTAFRGSLEQVAGREVKNYRSFAEMVRSQQAAVMAPQSAIS